MSVFATAAASAEPAACLSPDPSQWPAPSKPYFMIIVDTSGSMSSSVSGSNSCGYESTRIGHARCAVKNTIEAFAGEVNFGLATYTWKLSCPSSQTACGTCSGAGTCYPGCSTTYASGDDDFCGPVITEPNITASLNTTNHSGYQNLSNTQKIHAGGLVAVPLVQDNFWNPPLNPTNFSSIFNLVDNNCGNQEIGSNSNTPLGGALYGMNQYFSGTYVDPFTTTSLASPIGPATYNGQSAERACRSINVILITDGDETCDYYNNAAYPAPGREGLAVFEAGRLLSPGVTVSGQNFPIKTYVIGFAGATMSALNHIASAGGTTSAQSTANEAQLSGALAQIVGGSIKPETCDNTDNNCNGCTDEGFPHYCNTAQTCCSWTTAAQRTTCLNNYTASIATTPPKGNLALLPCTTPAQVQPATWLCYNPGDVCDNVDNNCDGQTDEGQLKCGSPLHCPQTETCNGKDDDCDGVVDNGNVCSGTCLVTPSSETCDGCDNDCDGIADNGVSVSIPCGPPAGPTTPPNCIGTITCKPQQSVAQKGGCVAGGGFTTCSNSPQTEICDGLDNDCNGIVDDNVPSVPCGPANLDYGPNSACKRGVTRCVNGATICVGAVGPSPEVCDGLDNDCNGKVDDGVPGVGMTCGKSQAPCTPGTTACVNGALVCTGGTQPKPETCNGVDDDCNGVIDDGALADAPAPGMNGCWDTTGTCCSFPTTNPTLFWCAPPGAGCNDNGSLATPCNHGALTCQSGAWICKGAKGPSPEVCDGADNDCNGTVDDGVQNVGTACGTNVGECKQGVLQCASGVLSCVGGVFPVPETCDGLDNDCDGTIDNGIPTGGPCTVPYDTTAYPGDRTHGPCKQGIYHCDGMGNLVCIGGVGPQPEVCDGVDNDCDGKIDEAGSAPDGINGSANPFPPPGGNIGDTCGVSAGACKGGTYACSNGQFACVGAQGTQPETCDCLDNDCDGQIDNPNPAGMPPLCSTGKDCVKSSLGCGCATPCDSSKEFPCPGGQICQEATNPNTGASMGKYCVSDPCGGDCSGKTAKDANGRVICAPAGTAADATTCIAPPVCVCKGQNGCKDPCFGVTCTAGTVCAEQGANAGKCVTKSCFQSPCQGCNLVCDRGTCITNPCTSTSCAASEACVPSSDFSTHTCVPSCANVTCPSGKACVAGVCTAACDPPCAAGQTCDTSGAAPACRSDLCSSANPCTDGSHCDPLTGSCGNDPCEGVVCPSGQACKSGSCFAKSATTSTGSTSASSSGSSASSGSTSAGAGGAEPGIWGLATGGGGCACEVGAGSPIARFADARWAIAAIAIALGRRRRSHAKRGSRSDEVAS